MARGSPLLPGALALTVALSGCVTGSHPATNPGGSPGGSSAVEKPAAEKRLPDLGPAREITGKDQDGKEFKLSDYRGKVVMLDFWGDW